ncbi:MAG: hypothetical protein ABWX67_11245 [Allosphingosinicella sp.]
MDAGGGSWGIVTIVGPLLLAAVLLWVLLRNRTSGKRDRDRTEQATRDLYREEEEKRRSGDDATS